MKLHYHPASTTSRIVELFVRDQGISLEYQLVDLFSGAHQQPDFDEINPNRLVPVLEDGNFFLTESSAISKYIADKTGSEAYPKDLQNRARVNEMMDWFNANFYKDFGYGFIYPQLFPHHKRPNDVVQTGSIEWAIQKTRNWLKILDERLIGPHKTYLCGEKISLADYQGSEIISLGDLIRCKYQDYPNVSRWMNTMRNLPSWGPVNKAAESLAASLSEKSFSAI